MLSGESAAGAYPDKAVNVLRQVATRIEEWCRCVYRPSPSPQRYTCSVHFRAQWKSVLCQSCAMGCCSESVCCSLSIMDSGCFSCCLATLFSVHLPPAGNSRVRALQAG